MRMDFPTYLPVWGGSLEKPSKETKNNYRKPENQSQHNDFPICGKNKRQKRNTKGHPFPAYLFRTKRKFPKASLTTSNGVS